MTYLNREGHKCFAWQLVGGKFYYPYGKEPYLKITEKNEVIVNDGNGEIGLETMLKSQLANKTGQHFYGFDPVNKNLIMCEKYELPIIRALDPLVAKVHSELYPE